MTSDPETNFETKSRFFVSKFVSAPVLSPEMTLVQQQTGARQNDVFRQDANEPTESSTIQK
ncbi:hypothetical protein [uncultured Martelella sp.]|uniref:hypothetical protein n=1 Tax=uncultured Martelella sp. TaxID=392331 RepID=UPI0029C79D21|nr:hypothetical protein [uncultured Martelella sp.]